MGLSPIRHTDLLTDRRRVQWLCTAVDPGPSDIEQFAFDKGTLSEIVEKGQKIGLLTGIWAHHTPKEAGMSKHKGLKTTIGLPL